MDNDLSSRPEPLDDLTARIERLSPEKRALLELRLKKKGSDTSREQTIPRRANRDSAALSFAQQRLWFLSQLEPDSPAYNQPKAIRLSGLLDVEALKKTLDHIVARHEALRTTFASVDGSPVQVIAESRSVELAVIDLSERPEADREVEVQRLLKEEAKRPFNLASDLMLRANLLRLDREEHVLFLAMHHIASDGWSMRILFRELAALYEAFSAGRPSPLSELPIQYADYALWQREWLQGEVLENQLSYWKQQLNGAPALLEMPTDRPRPSVQTYRGARQSLFVPKALTEGLKTLSRKEGVTLFMTLLAAFQTLLHRHTGQDDIVVGSPIAGRNRMEIEGLIGFFVNTLVLRTDLSGNPNFRELLGRVREVAIGAYAHQDIPFERLVEELQPQRDLSRTPLFQVFFNMLSLEAPRPDLVGLTVEALSRSEPESKFDLTLYVREQNEEIHLDLVYNADLFDQARTACILQQYRYLLEQIVTAPQKSIRSYSLVTPESRALLPDPGAVLAEPPQQLVTGIFASWAKRMPEHPAVSQGQQVWSYLELAKRAETLARVLLASGLEQGEVVGVYGLPSFGLIASMIGTLLSGGVILPLDHNLPSRRKQLMLREAKAKLLLYVGKKQSGVTWLEEESSVGILFVDPDEGHTVDAQAGLDLKSIFLPELSPSDPAYIFFTSGTTGIPKGVLGCHKGLSHFLNWQRKTFAIGPQDRSAQLTALSFDVVLRDIFLPLTSGATLCLPEAGDTLGPDEIIAWLERERISILHTVPTLAQSWQSKMAASASLRAMRWVFFAGEPLTEKLVRQWRGTFAEGGGLVNLYGPTETTLAKCFYRVPADTRPGLQPVGWPLPQTQALILAENSQLCGVNEPGEIVLRTPFRTLGYINAPEETQKRFVKNPFRDDAQDLIYFTGDAGRYRPDGTLEVLGRLDDQVKIRGVRVEPAEVTAILARHPAVKSNFVAAIKNEQGETFLVAYVVATKRENSTSTQLRSHLVQQLPAAMIPAFFVFLDSLPLTPNGKVDRRALPAPEKPKPDLSGAFVAPRNSIEEVLAGIWVELLKLQSVGIYDNFFDLGGHSLLATQVISRVRKAFGIDLPLRVIFEMPTVAQLAESVAAVQWMAQGAPDSTGDSGQRGQV